MHSGDGPVPGSFRDSRGFVFASHGRVYRQINRSGALAYEGLMASGLYEHLVGKGLLVSHAPVDAAAVPSPRPGDRHAIIEPERVPFISYPYEWCFSQLRDAALATIEIQRSALDFGHSLRDASAYNIQFVRGRPLLIDTLSFEPYQEGEPWVAYRQFCQHFLAPLALMAHTDVRLSTLCRSFIDGIPLDLASRLLPRRTRLSPTLGVHIHLHARTQKRYQGATAIKRRRVGRTAMLGLIDNLATAVRRLGWRPTGTEWGEYYGETNYSDHAMQSKTRVVGEMIEAAHPAVAWDLGANTGVFSRLASAQGAFTVAFDVDPAAVEKNYLEVRRREETHILPLVADLTNPSPALGWAHTERASLAGRGPVDLVMALALIHHLAISNNVPLSSIAELFASLGRFLLIEWVPKSDSQVKRLLATREDVFPEYHSKGFEAAFRAQFETVDRRALEGSERILYLLRSNRA